MNGILRVNMLVVIIATACTQPDEVKLRSEASYTIDCDSSEAEELRKTDNLFPCGEFNECVRFSEVCDTIIDCHNMADETELQCSGLWTRLCEDEERMANQKPFKLAQCTNKMCITECDLCDGEFMDCADKSDENEAMCSRPENQPDAERNARCERYNQARRQSSFIPGN